MSNPAPCGVTPEQAHPETPPPRRTSPVPDAASSSAHTPSLALRAPLRMPRDGYAACSCRGAETNTPNGACAPRCLLLLRVHDALPTLLLSDNTYKLSPRVRSSASTTRGATHDPRPTTQTSILPSSHRSCCFTHFGAVRVQTMCSAGLSRLGAVVVLQSATLIRIPSKGVHRRLAPFVRHRPIADNRSALRLSIASARCALAIPYQCGKLSASAPPLLPCQSLDAPRSLICAVVPAAPS
ncbi:hypothetical protein DFH06DRAFT_1365763 [Mycena polygramma]|nr:hypothetical protein DFH06DRAFT_1365763 [Mycena polygramma]